MYFGPGGKVSIRLWDGVGEEQYLLEATWDLVYKEILI